MQPIQSISAGLIGGSARTTGATTSFSAMPSGVDSRSFSSPLGQRWLAAISQATGLSPADVQGQLSAGGDVKDILQSKGVTLAEVKQTLRAQAGKIQHSGRHGHGGATQDAEAAFTSAVASTLGMNVPDLQQQLANGVGLDQLAAQQGISQDALNQSLRQTFQELTGYTSQGTPETAAASTGQVDEAA